MLAELSAHVYSHLCLSLSLQSTYTQTFMHNAVLVIAHCPGGHRSLGYYSKWWQYEQTTTEFSGCGRYCSFNLNTCTYKTLRLLFYLINCYVRLYLSVAAKLSSSCSAVYRFFPWESYCSCYSFGVILKTIAHLLKACQLSQRLNWLNWVLHSVMHHCWHWSHLN